MSNINESTQPIQKLPLSKKNQEWKENSVDYVISRQHGSFMDGSTRKDKMKVLYELYNGNYSEEDLKYVTNPFNVDDGFPATPQNFNIIRPKVDLLLGEETKRPFNFTVIQTNEEAVGKVQDEAKAQLMQYLVDLLHDTLEEEQTPEEIQKYMNMTFKTVAEETAYNSLNYLKEKLNLTHEFVKGFKDALIGGEEVYYVGVVNGEPILERINPLYCDYDKDPNLDFIEDGDWFLRHMNMTPAAIYDRFYDILEEKDLDNILDIVNERASSKGRASDVNTKSIMYKDRSELGNLLKGDTDDRPHTVNVWHAVWRSFKKIGFLTETDEDGESKTIPVSENYKADEGEDIVWDWVTEIWEGYRIGEDMYIGVQPVEYQHISVDNPNSTILPYTGVQYSNTNSGGKSLVSVMKPLQYMYIVIWYRLELALARHKGKVITMDVTQIPKSMGVDLNRWMHLLASSGVNLINPYEEGWDTPGREGGKPSAFNQFSQIDLSMSNTIVGYIDLMNKIEEMIGELSGVSKQRQGAIEQRELVGNVERAVIQSSHITEPIFWNHNQAKKRALISLLNTTKYAWEQYDKKKLHYIMPDATRIFLDITDEFLYSDYDIFLSDSTKEHQNIEALRTLLQPAMQNGATLLDVADILTNDNLTKIKSTLREVEQRREAAEKQAVEQEQQMAQMQVQAEMEIRTEENRLKEEDSIRKAQTDIEVALIQAAASENEGEVETDDGLDREKLQLQKSKQEDDSRIKRGQLSETVRSQRKAETQRQEEIQIKRKVANKPAASKTK